MARTKLNQLNINNFLLLSRNVIEMYYIIQLHFEVLDDAILTALKTKRNSVITNSVAIILNFLLASS